MFFRAFFQTTHFDEPTYQRSEVESEYIAPIELHVTGAAERVAPQVRQTLGSIDPNLSIVEMRSLSEQVSRQFNEERLTARLTELFSLLALLLASIGLYGVTAYNIARRTGEIGVRMALGADRGDVLKMVLRGAFVQIGLGLLIGVPLALATGRILASRLFRVPAFNLLILTAASLTLTLCALIAGFLPAHRAASIDPVEALRME
jgi:ABC-type antimicrobial peptide transport system permease subunit